MKRTLSAKDEDSKKARTEPLGVIKEDEIVLPPNVALPPQVAPPQVALPAEAINDAPPVAEAPANYLEDIANTLNELQKCEIRKISKLLSEVYADAPTATDNPNIYTVADEDWGELVYENEKSLAEIMHLEGGWTDSNMLDFIGNAPSPFRIEPLSAEESRALWASIRFRVHIKALRDVAEFEITVPKAWLGIKLKYKEWGKKGGKEFAMKLLALVSYNQKEFLGKPEYWFRPVCDQLGWKPPISDNFMDRHAVSLFVICCDPEMLMSSVEQIPGTWGGSNRGKFKTAWMKAVREAIKSKKVKYPSELQLLQNILPSVFKM